LSTTCLIDNIQSSTTDLTTRTDRRPDIVDQHCFRPTYSLLNLTLNLNCSHSRSRTAAGFRFASRVASTVVSSSPDDAGHIHHAVMWSATFCSPSTPKTLVSNANTGFNRVTNVALNESAIIWTASQGSLRRNAALDNCGKIRQYSWRQTVGLPTFSATDDREVAAL